MIVPTQLQHVDHVCHLCRESDLRAWQPLYFHDSVDEFVVSRFSASGIKMSLLIDDMPHAVGGFALSHPGTFTAWFIATPGWERRRKMIYKFTKLTIERLFSEGLAKRVQCWVIAGDEVALRFVRRLGFEVECLCEKLGDGVDYWQLRRLA